MPSMDILRSISNEELLNFIDFLSGGFPKTLRAHHYLLMHYRLKTSLLKQKQDYFISSRFRCNFFTHKNGAKHNCTIIAISDDRPSAFKEEYIVFIFSLEESNMELRECLENTKRIKWEMNPLIVNIQANNYPVIMDYIKSKNYGITWSTHNYCIWLSKDQAKNLNIGVLPENIKIAPLKAEDADLINDEWPHKSADSDIYIRTQIVLNDNWGIYDKETGRLLSWILTTENFVPGSLQTLSTEKRKGYAELLLRFYCKEMAEKENLDIIAFVMLTNEASCKLFRKIGFTAFDQCYWIKVNTLDLNSNSIRKLY